MRLTGPSRSWRTLFFALLAAGVVAAAAWVLLGSRLLVIRSVIVTGTHMVPRSEILAVASVPPGTPLIKVNTAQVAARVDTIRQLRSVRVTRSWPNQIVIAVRERTPALAVTAPGGGYDLVDTDGVVLRWAASQPADLPLYLTADPSDPSPPAGSPRGDPGLRPAAAVFAELPARLRHEVSYVTAPGPDQVTFRLVSGVVVVWGGVEGAAAKAQELTVLMRTHAHYYDVSGPGTVMTK